MIGKISLIGILLFFGALLVVFSAFSYPGYSDIKQTGTTKMNVTVRGWVAISVSDCLTDGITFATQEQNTAGNNASCNNISANGGTAYNLTVDATSTVTINFTHASNRTNLTTGTNTLDIGNVTYNSNSTENNATALLGNSTATSLSTSWVGMEECGTLGDGANCWETYFLDVPAGQAPGVYITGYCWCGRQQDTSDTNCGTCA